MALKEMDQELHQKGRFEKFSSGEYIEISCDGELLAEFEYCHQNRVFEGADYTENFDSSSNPCVADLEDNYRIHDVFKPDELLDMLNMLREEMPELSIYGRTLLEERINKGSF
jgi:hypothetical protein